MNSDPDLAPLTTQTSSWEPSGRRLASMDVTHRWLEVFEKYIGDQPQHSMPSNGEPPADQGDLTPPIGRLQLEVDAEGRRSLDRRDFRPDLPAPAEPGSSPSSQTARERQRADLVAAYAEQIAAATSEEERRFEEGRLELAIARMEGREPPATHEENRRVISQRIAFRQSDAPS